MIHEVHIFTSEPNFGKEYFVEISLFKVNKVKDGLWWLGTMWQPSLKSMTWIDIPIQSFKVDWEGIDIPIEFITYCDIYVEKFFKLKAFL